MEKKKPDFGTAATNAGKAAAGLFDKAKKAVVNAVDQNEDGKLGLDDVSILTRNIKKAAKDSSERRSEKQDQQRKEKEIKQLSPIFEEDLEGADFCLTKLIRVAEMDKKHADSELCVGSVGFESLQKELKIVQIYPNKLAAFGLSFYPDQDSELYYVDPCDRDHYIALDDYFAYLKVARISELQKIAQDLGAKHFRVTYKEQKSRSTKKGANVTAEVRGVGKQGGVSQGSHSAEEYGFSKVEIAAEMECLGHKPTEPVLRYFKKDPQIQSLIALRMSDNAMTHQVYTLQLSSSSGMKESDAMKIDAALSSMKINSNVSLTSKAQNEAKSIFEYEIEF